MLKTVSTASKTFEVDDYERIFAVECLTKICCYDSKI